MNYSFHPEAEEEFCEAIDYYEGCQASLGLDFAREVYDAIGRAVDYPEAWPILEEGIRRCQTHRFPYGVIYCEDEGGVLILAVMHLHRHPDYWEGRLG